MTKDPHILIIDDHRLFADGLALILRNLGGTNVTVRNDAQSALKDTDQLRDYDLILVDLHMPQFSGFDFLMAVKAQSLNLSVAVISGTDKRSDIERTVQLGAKGFISKQTNGKKFLKAVTSLLNGKSVLLSKWASEIDWCQTTSTGSMAADCPVTGRQLQVLELMSNGLQNKQIALALGISPYSVKDHVKNLFRNFEVHNRTLCVQTARDQNLI